MKKVFVLLTICVLLMSCASSTHQINSGSFSGVQGGSDPVLIGVLLIFDAGVLVYMYGVDEGWWDVEVETVTDED
jgi:hypothetical protein